MRGILKNILFCSGFMTLWGSSNWEDCEPTKHSISTTSPKHLCVVNIMPLLLLMMYVMNGNCVVCLPLFCWNALVPLLQSMNSFVFV